MAMGWLSSSRRRAAASQKRIYAFLHTRPEIVSPGGPIQPIEGDIEFRNVHFVYPDTGITALDDVSLSANKGESLAIIGHTGSGKSTVINLLVRMYGATSCANLIDGRDIRETNQIGREAGGERVGQEG